MDITRMILAVRMNIEIFIFRDTTEYALPMPDADPGNPANYRDAHGFIADGVDWLPG
jgi:hypothetical protein